VIWPLAAWLAINVPPIPYADHQDRNGAILNACQHTVIAYTIFPEASEFCARQGFADAAWIVKRSETIAKEAQYPLRGLWIELAKVLLGASLELNPPSHAA
jgi:hypothetical protein